MTFKQQVLFISHSFPPVGGPGVQRSTKFVKYLPQLGWQPTVLTTRYPSRPERDDTLLNDIPQDVEIIRTYSCEECNGVLSPFRYINTPFSIPDRANLWLPWAFPAAMKQIHRHSIKAIFATGPPFASHILAVLLKAFCKLPIILDYRDEWTLDPDHIARQSRHRRWFLPLERLQQRWVIDKADRILVVTESAKKVFIRTYGDLGKIELVRNGYDPEDFAAAIRPDLAADKFHIVYTGNTFSSVVKPDTFFLALDLALRQSMSLQNCIQVSFVGEMDKVSKRQVNELGLEAYVRTVGYLAHPRSVGYLLSAHVLLLISRAFPAFNSSGLAGKVPAKTYEYIGAGKPVLVLTPRDSESLKLIEQAGLAFWADPEDPDDIARTLIHLEALWRQGALTVSPNWAFIEALTRKSQAGQLAKVLDEVSGMCHR